MTPVPCGTRTAETKHRYAGVWPCRICIAVRHDVYEQIRERTQHPDYREWLMTAFAPAMTFGIFTDAERLNIAIEVARIPGMAVAEFARILGLPHGLARQFHAALTMKEAVDGEGLEDTA